MKKVISLLLALGLVFCMAACGESEGSSKSSKSDKKKTAGKVTIESVVLVDQDGIKIEAKELKTKNDTTELKLLLENNTDETLTFSCNAVAVNGYMVDVYLGSEIAAGKKSNETIYFSEMEHLGIETITDIELQFYVEDEEWDRYLTTDMLQIKTSAAGSYTQTYNHDGTTLYEGNGVEIIAKKMEGSVKSGVSVDLYMYNGTNKEIYLSSDDVSVNGYMVECGIYDTILPGKHSIATLYVWAEELEENDISKVEEIELSIQILDNTSWDLVADTGNIQIPVK